MYIRWFKDITKDDVGEVGGKNANLGEMYGQLTKQGVRVPNGFALTAEAYWSLIKQNKLDKKIKVILKGLNVKNVRALNRAGEKLRQLILSAEFPKEVSQETVRAYQKLSKGRREGIDVAVRSSATAEDLPDASFAGQQETYLNVRGEKELLVAVKKCLASLFTDRAISYREAKGFDHLSVGLSVVIQEMVRSDLGASGVMFTLDTESGFRGVVLIDASYGLGEYVVKGQVTPDQYFVFKDGVTKGFKSIISRRKGSKKVKLVYAPRGTKQEKVKARDRRVYCLQDEEVLELARWGMQIEEHYGRPMDIEWAKDGASGKLFIVQARAETVKSRDNGNIMETYKLGRRGKVLVEGVSVGQKIGQGRVRIINSPREMKRFKAGEVLVTRLTDPDWEPIMRLAGAIVTEQGGKTSHAAIVSRELGVPCLVGALQARRLLKNGQEVTVSCAEGGVGYVYERRLPFEVERLSVNKLPPTKTKIMMNIGDPERAFALASIPNNGVGLAREEFIFTNFIKIHPLALVNYKKIKNQEIKKAINELTVGYKDKKQYGIDKLAEGIAFIAAGFFPNQVILRLSDFKTNEYATLIGGQGFEPKEENPMLGWRGASRYYSPEYKAGFRLECAAIKKAREEWGLKNIVVMVPFCRTVEEGKKVLATMKEFGLERGKNGLEVYVMCEIPSNVLLAKEFSKIFDGFSIGSNDLTQLTLGVDRDSALVSHIYNENNAAVKKLIREVIQTAHQYGRKVGICGQAPSDYPEFAEFLVQEGIDSISLNPDTVLKTRERIAAMEKKVGIRTQPHHSAFLFKPSYAAKALSVLGAAGLFLTLTGYTCQTVNNQKTADELKATMATELLAAKAQLREEIRQEVLDREKKETRDYSEDSFVKFKLKYPSSWQLKHEDNRVVFFSSDTAQQFSVEETLTPLITLDRSSATTTWNSYNAYRGKDVRGTQEIEVLVIGLPRAHQWQKRRYLQLSGHSEYFEKILNSISGFEAKK